MHLRSKLSNTKKGDQSCVTYYSLMKGYADEMVAAGKYLEDEDVICYILAGLDFEYNPFVEAFTAKTEPWTLNDLYSQLLIVEACVESQKEQQQISANAAFRGGRGGSCGPMRGCGDGGSHGGRGGGRGNNRKIPWQVHGKTGHSALHCYKRFDANYNGEEKYANAATTRYNVDTEWYTDTGTTDHITSELDKLTTHEKYGGGDQVHTVGDSGMPIRHIGQSTISSHGRNLILKDILHVPTASKSLVFVHKFTHDNNAFFEIHPWYFFLKDQGTRKLFLEGKCRNDLYLIPFAAWSPQLHPPNKSVLSTTRPTMARWHHQLGHASSSVVHRMVSQNNLSFSKDNLD
jgi:hypothetical protein